MKIFQWLIDALLAIVLIIVIYKVYDNYYGTPPAEWKNPFQSLTWAEFKSVEFPKQNYSISVKNNQPLLRIGNKSWNIDFDKMQQYLDNWLILPKFQAQATSKNSNYGFDEKPDLLIQFKDKNLNIHLGRSVPGMEGSFYVSTSAQTIFTLPTALRTNLHWEPEHFLPQKPFKDKPQKVILPKELMTKSIALKLDNKNRWQFVGKKIYHKPNKLIERLSQIKLKPTINMKSLGKKLTYINWDQQQINIHETGFYNPQIELGWIHTKASKKWLKELKLEWISPYLKDHEVLLNQDVTQLIYPDGKVLEPKSSVFGLYLQKLIRFSGEVIQKLPPIPFEVFYIHCSSPKHKLILSGLKNDRFIAFSISEGLYLINSSKSVLP